MMFSCLRSSLNLNKEWRARDADWARVPHQPSETGTKSSQNKAVVTAKGGTYVGRGRESQREQNGGGHLMLRAGLLFISDVQMC